MLRQDCKEALALSCTLTESVGAISSNSSDAGAKSSQAAKIRCADLQKKPAARSRLRYNMARMMVQVYQELTQCCVFKRVVVMEPIKTPTS